MQRLLTITTVIALTCISYAGDETKLAMNMYSSQLAHKKGDLLTVVITESSSTSKKEAISTSKSASANSSVPVLGAADGRKLTKLLNDIEIPGFSAAAESEYTGSGQSSTEDELAATMTVRVMDVHDNGLLLIRGERLVETREEKLTIVLTGLVRPRDISAANAITSKQISDFKVLYESTGEVTRGSKPGWFWRILQFINPF